MIVIFPLSIPSRVILVVLGYYHTWWCFYVPDRLPPRSFQSARFPVRNFHRDSLLYRSSARLPPLNWYVKQQDYFMNWRYFFVYGKSRNGKIRKRKLIFAMGLIKLLAAYQVTVSVFDHLVLSTFQRCRSAIRQRSAKPITRIHYTAPLLKFLANKWFSGLLNVILDKSSILICRINLSLP